MIYEEDDEKIAERFKAATKVFAADYKGEVAWLPDTHDKVYPNERDQDDDDRCRESRARFAWGSKPAKFQLGDVVSDALSQLEQLWGFDLDIPIVGREELEAAVARFNEAQPDSMFVVDMTVAVILDPPELFDEDGDLAGPEELEWDPKKVATGEQPCMSPDG